MTPYPYLYFILQGAFYAVVVCGIRNLRVIIGPLPLPVCQLIIVSTRMVLWQGVMLITMITLTRFMFICVWRRMKQMNDDLVVRISIVWTSFMSVWISIGIIYDEEVYGEKMYSSCTYKPGIISWQSLVARVHQTLYVHILKKERKKS